MTSKGTSGFSASRIRRDRFFFFTGTVLALLGAALSLGSYAHDTYRVPLVGEAFDVFGWVNVTFLAVGLLFFGLGVAFVAVSLRGGLLPDYELSEETS